MREKSEEAFELNFSGRDADIVKKKKTEAPQDFSNLIMAEKEEKKEIAKEIITRSNNFVVVDIETTGLEPQNERITEIVALRYDSYWNYIKPVYHNLLNPSKRIPEAIQKLTKIKPEMVKYKPYSSHGVKDFLSKLELSSDILVAHNATFEYKWFKHTEKAFEYANWICTRGIYLYMRDGNTWDNNFTKDYSRLKQVCEYYGIEYKENDAHRAEYDVLKTRLVAEKMIKKLGLKMCLLISAEYVQGKGYGKRKTKEELEYERSPLPEYVEEVKGGLYD